MSAPEAEQRGITVRSECPASLPDINADPGMLQQAVLNLALNACQAMPNGGTLKLSAGQPRTAASRSTSRTQGSVSRRRTWARFSICISRPRRPARASACRWSSGLSSSTTGRSRSNRRQAAGHGSVSCSRRRKLGEPRPDGHNVMHRRLLIVLLLLPAAACASAQAKAPVEIVSLDVPVVPPRVIDPVPIEAPPIPPVDELTTPAPAPAPVKPKPRPDPNRTEPKTEVKPEPDPRVPARRPRPWRRCGPAPRPTARRPNARSATHARARQGPARAWTPGRGARTQGRISTARRTPSARRRRLKASNWVAGPVPGRNGPRTSPSCSISRPRRPTEAALAFNTFAAK